LFQTTHDDYEYYVGICGKLSQPGCEQSSLCRLKPGAAAKKFTYNDMFLEGGHLKLLYDLFSPSSSCGNNFMSRIQSYCQQSLFFKMQNVVVYCYCYRHRFNYYCTFLLRGLSFERNLS